MEADPILSGCPQEAAGPNLVQWKPWKQLLVDMCTQALSCVEGRAIPSHLAWVWFSSQCQMESPARARGSITISGPFFRLIDII